MGKELWVMVLDIVVSLILYFVGKYAGAGIFEDIKFLITAVQPLILAIIVILTGGQVVSRVERALSIWSNAKSR